METTTWAAGDPFQLAARGDRYDGVTGSVRKVFVSRGDHVHVRLDDGTITTFPTARLERPTNTPGGAVTSTPAPSGAPSLVELDRQEAADRLARWAEKAVPALRPTSLLRDGLTQALADYRAAVQS